MRAYGQHGERGRHASQHQGRQDTELDRRATQEICHAVVAAAPKLTAADVSPRIDQERNLSNIKNSSQLI